MSDTSQKKTGRPPLESVKLTKAARMRLDTLAAENADTIFEAILGAALGGDMSAARILADRIWPSRRGAVMTFNPPVIKAPEDRQPPEKRRQLVPLAQFFIEAHEQIVQIADLIEKNVTELRSALYE